MNRTRAWRRAQRERIRQKRIDQIYSRFEDFRNYCLESPIYIAKMIDTPCPCSCILCGHQRKWFGLTRQEIVAELEEQEQLKLIEPTE